MRWTYGPGALIDLQNLSVVTMGIDRWEMGRCQPIQEARLLTSVRRVLGAQVESGLRSRAAAGRGGLGADGKKGCRADGGADGSGGEEGTAGQGGAHVGDSFVHGIRAGTSGLRAGARRLGAAH